MKNKIVIILTGIVLIAITCKNSNGQNSNNSVKNQVQTDSVKVIYTCPMHSEVTSDNPGKCLKCGMDLVKKKKQIDKLVYTCPMHSDIISDKPGKCPKCGMELVKKDNSKGKKHSMKHSGCGMMGM